MFSIAFLIGIFAKGLFILGLLHLYSPKIIILYTLLFIASSIFFWKYFDEKISREEIVGEIRDIVGSQKVIAIVLLLVMITVGMGVLIPETSFDALWYHLTIPKLYLEFGGISFIPGSLFYYSALPKIGELLYVLPVMLGIERLAKLMHASFAILTSCLIYIIVKKETNTKIALLSVLIFLSNIVVLWQATTAYVDLMRTFFETLTLYGLLIYRRTGKKKWLVESAIALGLAIETKLIAISSLLAFSIFIWLIQIGIKDRFKNVVTFVLLALLVPLPWFIFSFLHTGNPIYPLFSGYPMGSIHPLSYITDLFLIFIKSQDPISPVYLGIIPLVIVGWKRFSKEKKQLFYLAGISLLLWTVTPKTGGGRFLLPYLPLFSICCAYAISEIRSKDLFKVVYAFICISVLIAVGYRLVAQADGVKYILGQESKSAYLTRSLNYSFGDFYDVDGYFKNSMNKNDKVLLIGFHNLYYTDFNYVDQSFVMPSDRFNFIATQHAALPKMFSSWDLIYENTKTGVDLYRQQDGRFGSYIK